MGIGTALLAYLALSTVPANGVDDLKYPWDSHANTYFQIRGTEPHGSAKNALDFTPSDGRAGDDLLSMFAGEITFAGNGPSYLCAEVAATVSDPTVEVTATDGSGLKAVYLHMASIRVSAGDTVVQGSPLGTVGNKGCSTGPHVHVSFYRNGTPIDPSGLVIDGAPWSNNPGQLYHSTNETVTAVGPVAGRSDLAILTDAGAEGTRGRVLASSGSSFATNQLWWDGSVYGWSGIKPLMGDATGDGRDDLVLLTDAGSDGTRARVLASSGSGFPTNQLWWDGSVYGWSGIKPLLGDVDGDGDDDLVILTDAGADGTKARVLRSNGASFATNELWWDGSVYGWHGIKPLLGDVTGDGKEDLVIITDAGANGTKARVLASNGSAFATNQLWWDGTVYGWSGIKPLLGDVTGDQLDDLVILTDAGADGTKARVLRSNGSAFSTNELWWDGSVYGWSGIKPLLSDVTGDRLEDLVIITDAGADGTRARVLASSGSGFPTNQLWWDGSVYGWDGIKPLLGDVQVGIFVDDDTSTFAEEIEWVAAEEITLGCDATGTQFCPGDPVTREQMASFLARALDLEPVASNRFDDVSGTHTENINAIAEAGITLGCTSGGDEFCPSDLVSREQMASFLARALGLDPVTANRFADVAGTHAGNINAIAEAGITLGCNADGTLYCPDPAVVREQMAAFLFRALAGA